MMWYLQQINQSPTSNTVVIETLRRALKIAAECNLRTIPVTFDLAIAKVAYQIQATESPAFDAVFINLGAFHIEMAYFNAIGKYINESGGPQPRYQDHVTSYCDPGNCCWVQLSRVRNS